MFDEEVSGHKAELELLSNVMEEYPSMNKQVNTNSSKAMLKTADEVAETSAYSMPATVPQSILHEVTRKASAKQKILTERRVSQLPHTHHNQDHKFAILADKEHQLKMTKQELDGMRELVQDMENGLEKLKRENAELVKLQGVCGQL